MKCVQNCLFLLFYGCAYFVFSCLWEVYFPLLSLGQPATVFVSKTQSSWGAPPFLLSPLSGEMGGFDVHNPYSIYFASKNLLFWIISSLGATVWDQDPFLSVPILVGVSVDGTIV